MPANPMDNFLIQNQINRNQQVHWKFIGNQYKSYEIINGYPPENEHIPYQGSCEDDFPLPKVGYVSFLEGYYRL